jgi:hypothetical protein
MSEIGLGACVQRLLDGQRIPDAWWAALRGALDRNLRRRGLTSRPPAYVGLDDLASWSDDGALDALTAEFYRDHVLPRLRHHWPARSDAQLAGLIDLMARQFLGERQRRHDRIGYFVHENATMALRIAVDRGALVRAPDAATGADHASEDAGDEGGDDRERAGARGPRAHRNEAFAPPGALAAARIPPEQWRDRLQAQDGWARVVPLLGSASRPTQEVLADAIADAAAQPTPAALTARDAVLAIRDDVRAALTSAAIDPDAAVGWDDGEGGTAELVRVVVPGDARGDAQDLARLADRLRARVGQLACQERVRAGLLRIIDQIADAGDDPPPPAELRRRLGIARSTLHELLQRLRPLIVEESQELAR